MLYKYCPNCGSLRVSSINGGQEHKCNTCDYQGEMKEDSIDKINDFRKVVQSKNENNESYDTYPLKETTDNKSNIKDKIKKMSTTSTKDWELL